MPGFPPVRNSFISPKNWVPINSPFEFPVQDDTTITFESGKYYIIGSDIVTPKKVICQPRTGATATTLAGPKWTYTGEETAFNGLNVGFFEFKDLPLAAPNGQYFDFLDNAPANQSIIVLNNVVMDTGVKMGVFDSLSTFQFINGGTSGFDAFFDFGLELKGSGWGVIDITRFGFQLQPTSEEECILLTAVCNTIELTDLFLVTNNVNAHGVSALAASANVVVGQEARLTDSSFLGIGTALENFGSTDIRWNMQGNSAEVPDSRSVGSACIATNTTSTALDQNTWTDLNLDSNAVECSPTERWELESATTGALKHIGEKQRNNIWLSSFTVQSTGSQEFEFRLVKNGLEIPDTSIFGVSTSGSAKAPVTVQIPIVAQFEDIFKVQVRNPGSATDITILTGSETVF